MENKIKLLSILAGVFAFVFSTATLHAKSWVCDAKATTGFNNEEGFRQLSFRSNDRYVIKDNISPDQLSLPNARLNRIFENSSEVRYPASIRQVGEDHTDLCTHLIITAKGFQSDSIDCESVWYGNFKMNVETGIIFSFLQWLPVVSKQLELGASG